MKEQQQRREQEQQVRVTRQPRKPRAGHREKRGAGPGPWSAASKMTGVSFQSRHVLFTCITLKQISLFKMFRSASLLESLTHTHTRTHRKLHITKPKKKILKCDLLVQSMLL